MSQRSSDNQLQCAGIWKTWVLICVSEASRLGVTPLATAQLHVLLYLANTLAPLFDVVRVRGRILKLGDYPFYPDVQPEIDRLAFSGILSIDRVDFGPRGHLAAHYMVGSKGEIAVKELLAHSREAERTAKLFRELVLSCFGKFLGTKTAIGPIDANYGDNQVLDGQVVDFSEWEDDNKNIHVARYLIDQLRSMHPNTRRDGVRLYCDYLDKALEIV